MEKKNKEYGMVWHHLLVFYYGLIGVLGMILGPGLIIFSIYTLEPTGVVAGLLCICIALYAFTVRTSLRNLEAGLIKTLVQFFIFRMLISFIDVVLAGIISNPDAIAVNFEYMIGAIVGTLIAIAINVPYYKKREDMLGSK